MVLGSPTKVITKNNLNFWHLLDWWWYTDVVD